MHRLILAIDGMSASYKTTTASLLAEAFRAQGVEASVISCDDFFLPMELRTKERLAEAGGNIHYERLKTEVIDVLQKQETIQYQKFDCRKMDLGEMVYVPISQVYIVEGAYASHPYFEKYYDLLVYLKVQTKEQIHRIKHRNGNAEMFVQKWIPMEQHYIEETGLVDKANIIIDTTNKNAKEVAQEILDRCSHVERKIEMEKVYFTRSITPEKVLELYKLVEKELPGKVAVKVHSGEVGNQNFLKPDFWKPMVEEVKGTVVECNTAYEGKRYTTKDHMETMKLHGWTEYFDVEILDAEPEDMELEIPKGEVIKKNYVGKGIEHYQSMLVLSHFKGHPMGGYGGAIKQLSIGVASSYGKAYIHGAGEAEKIWTADHDLFLRSMADAASSVVDYFKGNIIYVNVMKNMSVDCDCCAVAEDPCMQDIGILVSTDPVAIDQACIDLVYASKDPGRDHLVERIESRNGILTIEAAEKIGVGSRKYELIEVL